MSVDGTSTHHLKRKSEMEMGEHADYMAHVGESKVIGSQGVSKAGAAREKWQLRPVCNLF